jgi:2-polyprenyl-6-methoxyphenol hydroxylase-like FAD-dependent oxidoreductase
VRLTAVPLRGLSSVGSPRSSKANKVFSRTGFGGLSAAIECHRQGHNPVIYEQFPELKALGDIISFGPNAGRIFYRWGDGKGSVVDRMRPLSINTKGYGFNIHKYDTGEVVRNQKTPEYPWEAPSLHGHRGELHEVVFRHVRDELKVPVHLNRRIEEYFEDEDGAGIILDSGETVRDIQLPRGARRVANCECRSAVML